MIRAIGAFDRRWLGGFFERRALAYDEKRYGPMRAIHPTGLFEIEEDDQVLYYSMAAGFWITKMPYMGDLDFYYVDRWPERRRRRLMRFYADCIRRQLYLNGRDRIHLSKNPVFPGRLETLLETFPDARIVVPMRNPHETIPSLLELMRSGWKALGWDPARQQRCLEILADQSFHTYLYPLEVLARHPEIQQAVIDYRDLVSDPAASIEQIYRAARPADLAALPRGAARRGQTRAPAQVGAQLQSREVRARRGRDPQRARGVVRTLRMGTKTDR